MKSVSFLTILICLLPSMASAEIDHSGEISAQWQLFLEDGQYTHQERSYISAASQPRTVWYSETSDDIVSIELFGRIVQHDNERSHVDIRELLWDHAADTWVLRAGIGIVFWGVTESQHLVDIINQTDNLEGVDGEDKLGQPMINLSLEKDWGTIDTYILPWFRERKFGGEKSRLRPDIDIDDSAPEYESSREQKHIDLALRWSHYVDAYDFSLSYFRGTQREPLFNTAIQDGTPVLIPYYAQTNVFAGTFQATLDAWLWKLEAARFSTLSKQHFQTVGGFEYSIYGVMESSYDIGLISEYHFDERGDNGSTFDNDLMLGLRFVFNDVDSTEILFGTIIDLDDDTTLTSLEAAKRFGNNWKASLEMRLFDNVPATRADAFLNKDDFIQLDISYYY